MLAFHACPPPGHWANDPNALFRDAHGWVLLAQYRDDPPAFARTHWGRWRSTDLLRWTFEGVAIAADASGHAYSGSVVRDAAALVAFHTRHDPASHAEHQVRVHSGDGGLTWSPGTPLALGPAAPDQRDPFVWQSRGGGWRMLLARPALWGDAHAASHLELWQADAPTGDWSRLSTFPAPLSPGCAGEVPLFVPGRDGVGDLVLSAVDFRHGGACSVLTWPWLPDAASGAGRPPAPGRALDLGPDFYAAQLAVDRLDGEQLLTGWLGSWATARAFPWPGFGGGPIALPRVLGRNRGGALVQRVPASLAAAFTERRPAAPVSGMTRAEPQPPWQLTLTSSAARLSVTATGTATDVSRTGAFPWAATHPPTGPGAIALFVDGPATELFLPCGRTVTTALPTGGGPFTVTLADAHGAVALDWRTLPQAA